MSKNIPHGFTLIELILVIAIVAIISVVVVLTLNPAELLRRARDANRISDIGTLRTSISFYLANVAVPHLSSSSVAGNATSSYLHCWATTATSSCAFGFNAGGITPLASSSATSSINSQGWLPVDFTQIPSGPPIGSLPIDPVNNGNYFYAYAATSSNLTFKIVAAAMESQKYSKNGPGDVVSKDGGSFSNVYETGTNLSL